MNTAQVLVEMLKEYGVEHIFGVPGDTTMVLYDALYAARGEITHIMARDERSAAFNEPIFIDVPTRSELEEVPPVHAWQQALQLESTLASGDSVPAPARPPEQG